MGYLHLHILWDFYMSIFLHDSLNGYCMGSYIKYFRKGSRFQFLEFVFENLQGFLFIPSYRIIYMYGVFAGGLHKGSSQGVFTRGLRRGCYTILIQKWVTYSEMSDILINELYPDYIRRIVVVWDFIKNIFRKFSDSFFGICFLRTFKDFYTVL